MDLGFQGTRLYCLVPLFLSFLFLPFPGFSRLFTVFAYPHEQLSSLGVFILTVGIGPLCLWPGEFNPWF